jgi:hypothetical protein
VDPPLQELANKGLVHHGYRWPAPYIRQSKGPPPEQWYPHRLEVLRSYPQHLRINRLLVGLSLDLYVFRPNVAVQQFIRGIAHCCHTRQRGESLLHVLQPMQCGIERHLQRIARHLLNSLGNCVAVNGAQCDNSQDQEVESALRKFEFF